ncbi:15679_t:CDS:2, partial [Cetraspora pellucida]
NLENYSNSNENMSEFINLADEFTESDYKSQEANPYNYKK